MSADHAQRDITAKVLEIRDIATRETLDGRMAGPTHRQILEATDKLLRAIRHI